RRGAAKSRRGVPRRVRFSHPSPRLQTAPLPAAPPRARGRERQVPNSLFVRGTEAVPSRPPPDRCYHGATDTMTSLPPRCAVQTRLLLDALSARHWSRL